MGLAWVYWRIYSLRVEQYTHARPIILSQYRAVAIGKITGIMSFDPEYSSSDSHNPLEEMELLLFLTNDKWKEIAIFENRI